VDKHKSNGLAFLRPPFAVQFAAQRPECTTDQEQPAAVAIEFRRSQPQIVDRVLNHSQMTHDQLRIVER
jgi:hypothetical protein